MSFVHHQNAEPVAAVIAVRFTLRHFPSVALKLPGACRGNQSRLAQTEKSAVEHDKSVLDELLDEVEIPTDDRVQFQGAQAAMSYAETASFHVLLLRDLINHFVQVGKGKMLPLSCIS